MPDLDETVKSMLAARQARDGQLLAILDAPDDITSLVLRAHLVAEELLYGGVSAYCADPEQLKHAKLRFPQLVALLRALDKLPSVQPKIWNALGELNSLRNSLAHVLEPKDVEKRVQRFIDSLEIGEQLAGKDQKDQLRFSVSYIVGGLSAATTFQSFFEEFVRHKLRESQDER